MQNFININNFNYSLPDDSIAKYPLDRREMSKLLIYQDGKITDSQFCKLLDNTPPNALLAFNQTKVVRARIILHKPTGARIEIFCLEPSSPADYERAFAARNSSSWHCMIGNLRKFNTQLSTPDGKFTATRTEGDVVNFNWTTDETFGELLERLGRVPIPPYLNRESETLDNERYQTMYARIEGSVAAPTAGLHFSPEMLAKIENKAFVTLHVGAGTFLPVKETDATKHPMHTEIFEVSIDEIEKLAAAEGNIIAIGTTTVRTIESLATLGGRLLATGSPNPQKTVGQWETYPTRSIKPLCEWMRREGIETLHSSTQTMITPGYKFATIRGLVTNFHQPKSTLLLLITAIVGDDWTKIYDHALSHNYRFLSYGDSSLLMCKK